MNSYVFMEHVLILGKNNVENEDPSKKLLIREK